MMSHERPSKNDCNLQGKDVKQKQQLKRRKEGE
jgi:hypothetical protein